MPFPAKVAPQSFFTSGLLLRICFAMSAASGLELHAVALEQAAHAPDAAIANPTALTQMALRRLQTANLTGCHCRRQTLPRLRGYPLAASASWPLDQ